MLLLSFYNMKAVTLPEIHLILRWEICPLLMTAPIHTCSHARNVDSLCEKGFDEFYNMLFVCFFNNMCRIRKYHMLAPMNSRTKNNSLAKSLFMCWLKFMPSEFCNHIKILQVVSLQTELVYLNAVFLARPKYWYCSFKCQAILIITHIINSV